MPSRTGKDDSVAQEKREMASLTVKLDFLDFDKLEDFNVYEEDPKKRALMVNPDAPKYVGKVTADRKGDHCSCPSFDYGMGYEKMEDGSKGESIYLAQNGYPFNCKHIICARRKRFAELDNRKQGIYNGVKKDE